MWQIVTTGWLVLSSLLCVFLLAGCLRSLRMAESISRRVNHANVSTRVAIDSNAGALGLSWSRTEWPDPTSVHAARFRRDHPAGITWRGLPYDRNLARLMTPLRVESNTYGTTPWESHRTVRVQFSYLLLVIVTAAFPLFWAMGIRRRRGVQRIAARALSVVQLRRACDPRPLPRMRYDAHPLKKEVNASEPGTRGRILHLSADRSGRVDAVRRHAGFRGSLGHRARLDCPKPLRRLPLRR